MKKTFADITMSAHLLPRFIVKLNENGFPNRFPRTNYLKKNHAIINPNRHRAFTSKLNTYNQRIFDGSPRTAELRRNAFNFPTTKNYVVSSHRNWSSTMSPPVPVFSLETRHFASAAGDVRQAAEASIQSVENDHMIMTFSSPSSSSSTPVLSASAPACLQLHFIWLRDHCRCSVCFNASTNQRSLEIDEISLELKPKSVHIKNASDGGQVLNILWEDEHVTDIPVDFLLQYGGGLTTKTTTTATTTAAKLTSEMTTTWEASLWNEALLPVVKYRDFMESDKGLRHFLDSLLHFGFAIVDGAEATPEGTRKTAQRLCFIQTTTFGDIWTFTADMKRGDTAYTNIALGSHNDSTYLCYGTGIQVFHVQYHDGTGGQTTLVDGFRAAEKLLQSAPECFAALTKMPVKAEYLDDDANLQFTDKIIKLHPVHQTLEQIRFNIYDRSPMSSVCASEIPLFYSSLTAFAKIIKEPSMVLEVPLRPGQVLFVDNWRVMHGRRAFDGKREVSGCYLPRDDWRSKARMMGCQL